KAIRRLYARCPPRTAVICFDEWGPLELKPRGRDGLGGAGQAAAHAATYRRLQGVRHFLGFYDVHRDCLGGIFRRRKCIPDLLAAFRRLRCCYPRRRLFVVQDHLPHTSTIIRASCPAWPACASRRTSRRPTPRG